MWALAAEVATLSAFETGVGLSLGMSHAATFAPPLPPASRLTCVNPTLPTAPRLTPGATRPSQDVAEGEAMDFRHQETAAGPSRGFPAPLAAFHSYVGSGATKPRRLGLPWLGQLGFRLPQPVLQHRASHRHRECTRRCPGSGAIPGRGSGLSCAT